MIRFLSLGNGFAVFAIAFVITAIGVPFAVTQERTVQHTEHEKMLQDCAKACSDCQRACDMCSTHCAHQVHEGKKEHIATLMTCQDCSTFCAAASQITARGGPFAQLICMSCADACARCGAECEKFPNDSHMKACAEECRRCEKACRGMGKHGASK
jgi:hypothetical protein